MPFNEDEYKQKLIDWAIKLRLSYREVTDESTTDLLTYGKPPLARLLPTHHSTLSRWVKDSMAARLPFIIEFVQSALSTINLLIDGWRAHNRREYIAVCGHFVDGQGHPRTLLLGFPRRYGGHTGDDLAALVNLIEASEEQRVALWTLKGVIGKLHNLVVYINRNDARREQLRARMRVTKTSDGMLFVGVLLSDGGIRWNATFYMIERALKYGEGNEGGQGSVWQVLYAMDFLLTKLESVKEEIHAMDADNKDELPPYYSAGVLAAWSKINTYYELTDRSPIYLTVATDHVDQAETSPCSSPTIDDEFDAWGHTTDRPHRGKRRKVETEWEVWIKQVPSKDDMNVKNPLAWWVDRRHVWPILSKLALNIFSTPAMSAEPERVFSDGGELITDKRNGLGDDTVEAEMIQKNWITSKILHRIATPRGLYKLPD
ncbi:transposase-like protein [Hirsutella rhossiliensis]|uniref:Transposase-like protein n=1 Tax=Hirsutella rhossiliensis TaxID=111463 RepID=A0A9P8ML22_9HYPO|nr:transposase-like protein [Hirsutella rhossiliensis]KAH0957015.1 transposase-like protein [Hirsutella rhossiliensis]